MITNLKSILAAIALLAPGLHLCSCNSSVTAKTQASSAGVEAREDASTPGMLVQYLEVVSSDVDATCSTLSKVHGVTFGEPDAMLGNARLATLKGGGMIGVRASMAEHDVPIVRPYVLVEDIEAAVKATEAAGGEFAMRATEIPGHGKFAIYFLGGTQFGLWEKAPSQDQPR